MVFGAIPISPTYLWLAIDRPPTRIRWVEFHRFRPSGVRVGLAEVEGQSEFSCKLAAAITFSSKWLKPDFLGGNKTKKNRRENRKRTHFGWCRARRRRKRPWRWRGKRFPRWSACTSASAARRPTARTAPGRRNTTDRRKRTWRKSPAPNPRKCWISLPEINRVAKGKWKKDD